MPSCFKCFTRLRTLRAFKPYASLCLTRLHVLRALLTRLIYALRAFSCALHVLFVSFKILLGWLCIPAETFHFPRSIKGTTNRAVLYGSKSNREAF